MAADEKWYFTKEQLATTPSRRCGFDADKELSYRQQAANFIQDMGQRLVVSQLCINTAIVYMHRFYVFHSLTHFHRNAIAAAALFLAAKVEEQPRKLEHVIKVAHLCLHREQPALDTKSEQYLEQAQDLVFNENVLLQTLGFDVAIDHPHTHVVRCCHLVKASKDLAQTSYFMASNSLHLTTMCLQYKPTVVACFCIHLACKWSNWEIPQSNEGKHWFWYVDRTVTSELLQQLTAEFLHIFDRCPSRLKRKIMSISANQSPNMSHPSLPSSPFDMEPRKIQSPVSALDGGPTFQSNRPHHPERSDDKKTSASASGRMPVDYREYREKKERLDREKAAAAVQGHAHHHKPVPLGAQITGKHPVPPLGQKPHVHHNHHHNRPDLKPGAQLTATQIPPSSRHSVNSQQRDSAARQRLPREFNTSSGTSGGTVFTHGHGATGSENPAGSSSMADSILGRGSENQGITGDGSSHNPQEKQGNNNSHHSAENKHIQAVNQSNDKRQYDPVRHKPPEHRKEDSQQKLYGKYATPETSRIERQRKQPDILEQRSEEVRKLIEKPLPIPVTGQQKSRQEIQKEEYAANMIKQPHHHQKYGQEKIQGNPVVVLNQMKGPFNAREKSPGNLASGNASGAQQVIGKSNKPLQPQYAAHHPPPQSAKDNVRNGNAQSNAALAVPQTVNLEDIKTEKKPRPEELERMVSSYVASHQNAPGVKHRSLFSPEKSLPPNRESSHGQRAKPKQKTPPSSVRNIKQEPIGLKQNPLDLISPFASPPSAGNHPIEHNPSFKRAVNEVAPSSSSSHNKRHRASSICEQPEQQLQQQVRIKVEDVAGLDAMKMLGRVPELIQPIRDNPSSSNGKSSSVANDLKPPELIKPFEPEPLVVASTTNASSMMQSAGILQQQQTISNGYDLSRISNVQETLEVRYTSHDKREQSCSGSATNVSEHNNEYLSPLKSARGISALLQETTITPIPSLLQHQHNIQQIQQIQQNQQLGQVVDTAQNVERVAEAPVGASATVQTPSLITTAVVGEEKKSEHHKSEKKKKKDKHKHKDKDKGKEERKHKHKHKDREKDRHHRDKDRGGGGGGGGSGGGGGDEAATTQTTTASVAIPIKITIPKDKINLGAGGDASSTHPTTEGSSLKIKIPKERLKGGENQSETQVQAPLKIKIRTGASLGNNVDGRKRERETDVGSPTTGGPPPSKKHSQGAAGPAVVGNYAQRSGATERQQNGRHYATGMAGNNKEKHSSSSSYYKTSSKSTSQHSSHPT